MPNVKERLHEANQKVDSRMDEIWKQADINLKKSEDEFYKNNEGRKKK